jgi:hypothetical protein
MKPVEKEEKKKDEKAEILHEILKKQKREKNEEEKKTECEEEKTKQLLEKSEISLILDSYDDIFSDFDPRPFSQRALSDDFLVEAKRAARDKIFGMELKFLVPYNKRNPETEATIKKRLREHFKKHHEELGEENKKTIRVGIASAVLGIILMIGAALVYQFFKELFFWTIVFTILEPAGWFITWRGFDLIFYISKVESKDLEFYKKMSKAEISFMPY